MTDAGECKVCRGWLKVQVREHVLDCPVCITNKPIPAQQCRNEIAETLVKYGMSLNLYKFTHSSPYGGLMATQAKLVLESENNEEEAIVLLDTRFDSSYNGQIGVTID